MAEQKWWHDIGPCAVLWGESGSETELGNTFGGARWRLAMETAPSFHDITGDEPVDEIVTASPFQVETDFTSPTLDQLAKMVPGATLSEGPTSKALSFGSAVGMSLKENAKSLILKPIIGGEPTTDETLWLKCAKAFPKPQFEVVADAKTQRVYKVQWAVFRDDSGHTAVLGKQES